MVRRSNRSGKVPRTGVAQCQNGVAQPFSIGPNLSLGRAATGWNGAAQGWGSPAQGWGSPAQGWGGAAQGWNGAARGWGGAALQRCD